ncbi:Peptidyl-prolyl cis-trans isomerase, FKBP-type [Phytophthora cactorum]|nr:Peptidyl-prolyl cis-trans isomerase, FKBP-type [Phytophthora cactorum]
MGLTKEVLAEGNGPTPTKARLRPAAEVWSTKDPGQTPFTFNVGLGQVIKGWDEGVLGMKLGEQARLTCTPDYAYGAGGFPAWGYPFSPISYMDLGFRCTIQPNSTLIFEIEVLKIE